MQAHLRKEVLPISVGLMQKEPQVGAVHIHHDSLELASLEVGLLVGAELQEPVFAEATVDTVLLRVV